MKKMKTNKVDSPKENLTRKELEELMGTKRDTYKRKNGAIRRK